MTRANKSTLDFMIRAQKAMLEEMVFASNEIFDRIRTETHLFCEFVSKMAGSHSVKDLRTMCEECGQHQIDFVRRDSERLFKHGERMIENTSNLFSNRPQTDRYFDYCGIEGMIVWPDVKEMDSVPPKSGLTGADVPRLPCRAHAVGYGERIPVVIPEPRSQLAGETRLGPATGAVSGRSCLPCDAWRA